ncbi:MAG: hypothetical protein A2W25_12295 [candidate division Zixibacteria bacterium RBG_16_53_22]|nr:MAG: hypothetical protein A2W25_12295 [candidate division Zixibacteria bacterium RBG_16_53_22]
MKLKRKTDIIKYLEDKDYRHAYDYWPIAWNIKVYDWSFTIGKHYDVKTDHRWDDKWEEYVEKEDWLFNAACEDWLGFTGKHPDWDIMEGHPDQDVSDTHPLLYTAGRSGGWLVLDEINLIGSRYNFFRSHPDWQDFEYGTLWVLYKFCVEMDKIVEGRHQHMRWWFAHHRQEMECEWAAAEKEEMALQEATIGPVGMAYAY